MGGEGMEEVGGGGQEGEGGESVIVVTFSAPGSAEFGVKWRGVTPTQLLVAAEYLRIVAEKRIQERWVAEAIAQAREAEDLARVQGMLKGGVQ